MNLSDFIQWIGTARRHPLSALCASICLLCVLLCWLIHTNTKWLELEHKQLSQDGDLMIGTLVTGPAVRQELAASREVTRRIEDNLVIEDNLAENLWYFYKIEQQTKAKLPELHQLNSVVTDAKALYKLVPYTIRVTGTYEQAAAFLYAIETGPRIANINSVSIRRIEPGSPFVDLDLNLELLGKR